MVLVSEISSEDLPKSLRGSIPTLEQKLDYLQRETPFIKKGYSKNIRKNRFKFLFDHILTNIFGNLGKLKNKFNDRGMHF